VSIFEDKISRNKNYFDNKEPQDGHRERFINKLNEMNSVRSKQVHYRTILSIAAVLIVLIVAATLVYNDFTNKRTNNQSLVEAINYSENLENVLAYYDAISLQKVNEIDNLVPDSEKAKKLKQIALNRLEDIDGSLASIEKELAKNPEDENIKSALINNKRKKVEVMNDILLQLDLANSSLF